jgi:hypothetical protein
MEGGQQSFVTEYSDFELVTAKRYSLSACFWPIY